MESRVPLPALLSQALVAFTIEFDNEFEHQTPHRTTNHGSTPGFPFAPWLVSMAMWVRYMQFVPPEGISVVEWQERAGISNKGSQMWLTRLGKWWGYLTVRPAAPGAGAKRIAADAMIVPTAGGRMAIEVWSRLTPLIEKRWQERFGAEMIGRLTDSLRRLASQLSPELPEYFSVLEYEDKKTRERRRRVHVEELPLPQLLARVLLAFASDYDNQAAAPLASCANVLRVTGDDGVFVRELPRLTGLAVEGVAAAIRDLARRRLAVVGGDAARGRGKVLLLTEKGKLAREQYLERAVKIEQEWRKRLGEPVVGQLRDALDALVGPPGAAGSLLLRGIEPYADGWRASLPCLEGLPHFPAVSHRGGFPDGS